MHKSKTSLLAVAWQNLALGVRVLMGVVAVTLSVTAWSSEGATATYNLDIPSQKLSDALQALALATKHRLVYSSGVVDGKRAPAVRGGYTTTEAVERLLAGTGLKYEVTEDGLVVIRAPGDRAASTTSLLRNGGDGSEMMLSQSSSSTPSPVSGEVARGADEASARSPSQGEGEDRISEIIVTAQKREERLQDVPVPVTAISGELLVNSNQLRLQDYYTRIPGLAVGYDGIRGALPTVVIRGLAGASTVGIVVDDIPYGSSTDIGGGAWVPEIDPSDLTQVEVSRGPQGTLYGASSMGGQLKFVTADPSVDKMFGRVQVGTGSVHGGDSLGYTLRGAVNVPLGETFAVRASGFTRRDPGYIDNVQTGEEDVNRTDVDGGRLSALWRPTQGFSLKLSALIQKFEADGSSHIYPSLGDLEQSALRGSSWLETRAEVYNATVAAKLGNADFVSVSGYNIKTMRDALDSPHLGGLAQFFYGAANGAAVIVEDNRTEKLTQEFRLSVPFGSKFEWLVGAFYTDERSHLIQPVQAANSATGVAVGPILDQFYRTTLEEYAAFTDLTVKFTDRFDVQIGGRFSEINQMRRDTIGGPLTGGTITATPELKADGNPVTYLLTPRFKLSPDLMVYARVASGYRAGGTNGGPAVVLGNAPRQYDPDSVVNYELGTKGYVFNRAMLFDVSLYRIDWKDYRTGALIAQGAFITNAGGARSQGVELSVEARPLRNTTMAAWVALNDAELTDDLPPGTVPGLKGDRLGGSRVSANVSLEQAFTLSTALTGFAGASASYVGERLGAYAGSADRRRQVYPAYTRIDLSAGLNYGSWTANFYVNNITDKRALLSGGLGQIRANAFSAIQPRTAGLSIAKEF